jgi:hypothetical protein
MGRSPLRVTLCFFLGFITGISFLSSILPFLVAMALDIPSLAVLVEVDRFTVHVALLWAICGGLLAWIGGPRAGAFVLGTCGLASGLFLGFAGLGGTPMPVAASAAAGIAYGSSAGALLGHVFRKPAPKE